LYPPFGNTSRERLFEPTIIHINRKIGILRQISISIGSNQKSRAPAVVITKKVKPIHIMKVSIINLTKQFDFLKQPPNLTLESESGNISLLVKYGPKYLKYHKIIAYLYNHFLIDLKKI